MLDPLPLSRAAWAIREGRVVAFPTETLYGLAANPWDANALRALVALKGRDEGKPVSLIVSDMAVLESFVEHMPERVARFCAACWPGPTTVVFRATHGVEQVVTGGTGTVAVRVPSAEIARELARLAGGAITATSANRQGDRPATTAEEISEQFADELASGSLAGIADGSPAPGGPPSTLVRPEGERLTILRPGAMSPEQLAEWWPGAVVPLKGST